MKVWSQKNLEDIRHEYIDFDGEWYLAFGRPEKSGCWIIYGKSGQGKSSFALQLARKFDEMGLRVLYLTLEMGACDDFVNSVLDVGISSKTNNIIYSDEATIKENLMAMSHSRLILAHGELDNIAGIVLTHKVLNDYIETGILDFQKHLREPVIVHENAQVLMVMEQLRQAPLQMAIVLNEYGSIEGIATPIDVLEAIAGEFPDEDELDAAAESLADGSLILEGSTDIRHVSLLLGRDLVDESEQYSTLSGYILHHLGRLPENGQKLQVDGYEFEVVTMDGHKIEKVHIMALKPSKDDE